MENREKDSNMLDKLCSIIIFDVKYQSGIFNRTKIVKLKVWFTDKQIYKISDISSYKFFDKIPDVEFKVGDKIDVAKKWASNNDFEIYSIKKRHKSNRSI